VFVIGDLLYENPLVGRRIVHAMQNGAKIYALVDESSVTSNIADECFSGSVSEFLDKNDFDESSVLVFNKIDTPDDLEKIEGVGCKILPVFSKPNTKGALSVIDPKSKEELAELLDDTKLLLVFNDDIVDDFDYDFSKISKIISFAPCENSTTEMSDIVVPIKTWLEKDGAFVNAMGESQAFSTIVESDVLSEIEIIEKLKG
jgi:formate dehydrogenase major subunit